MSDILSIRIHEGGDLAEKEMIVLPKGTTVLVPHARLRATVTQRRPLVVEVNISTHNTSPDAIERLAREAAAKITTMLRNPTEETGAANTEIHLG